MKDFIKLVNGLRKTKKGRAYLFWIFSFIFFLILMIYSRSIQNMHTNNTTSNSSNTNTTKSLFSYSELLNNNYSFIYKINIDNNTYLYEGKRLNNKSIFTFNNNKYYQENDNYYKFNNNKYIKDINPIKFEYLLDINNITDIIDNSYYYSKTDYESGKKVYNYLISTNNINKLMYNNNTDIDDISNEINYSTYNNSLNEITYNLDSLCKYIDNCNNNLVINIKYDNIGSINKSLFDGVEYE